MERWRVGHVIKIDHSQNQTRLAMAFQTIPNSRRFHTARVISRNRPARWGSLLHPRKRTSSAGSLMS